MKKYLSALIAVTVAAFMASPIEAATGIRPGTGASNAGKAEDAVHASGDVGSMCLAVRNDTLAALATTDGDYAPFQVSSTGAVFVENSAMVTDLAAIEVLITAGNVDLAAIEVTQDALVVDLAAIEVTQDALVVDLAAIELLLATELPATSMACVEINVDATGTAEQGADLACKYVMVSCQVANTSNCFVRGTTGNGVTGGLEIIKGSNPVRFDVGNTNDLWFDAGTNDDDVRVCCLVN